jgi:membrane associated rhomboid family serine protease
MHPAPVGFHCPGCIAEARRTVRKVRTNEPRITKAIIGLCVAVFILGQATGRDFSYEYGLAGIAITEYGEYYRFITAMFLHASLIHILFNMLILWQIGSVIEMRIGSARYLMLYVLSGLGGGLASFALNDPYTLSVGASGAIFGLLGAYVVLARRLNINHGQVLGLIAINLILGFTLPGIDWHAHVGGLVVGAAVAAALPQK